jgi:hypothetical protein
MPPEDLVQRAADFMTMTDMIRPLRSPADSRLCDEEHESGDH